MNMVARIRTPAKLSKALNYNEQKVALGTAELLWSAGYLKPAKDLNFYQKLERFENLMALNNSKTNSLHISLNFPVEDRLNKEKLVQIADDYMERIGFGKQPYLVYQHFDAAHPHLHIVTCSIRPDGSRIDTWRIGQKLSEPARKAIEENYGLVKAGERERLEAFRLKPVNGEQVKYGKSPTERAITNVLDAVLTRYQYNSLQELNAILLQYRIAAVPANNNGLVYRVLDDSGRPTGIPIRASAIYNKPTLRFLAQQFAEPGTKEKTALRNAIDLALQQPITLRQLMAQLKFQGIATVLRTNADGRHYGVTFVDHRNRCVLNGSALGKAYSIASLQARCITLAGSVQLQLPPIGQDENMMQEQMDWQLKRTKKKRKKQQL